MTSLILALVLRDDRADAAFGRFVKAMAAMPSFEVHLVSKFTGRKDLTADMVVDHRKSLLFDSITPVGKFVLTISPKGYREVDWYSKSYDEFPYPGLIHVFESRLLPKLPATIPTWVLSPDLRQNFPRDNKFVYVRSETVAGHACDVVETKVKTLEGTATVDFSIAANGLVYRNYRTLETATGHMEMSYLFGEYTPLKSVSPSRFENRIPDGFMPHSLPDRDYPPEVGKQVKLQGWVQSNTGKAWSPNPGKPVLFMIVNQGSLPSERAIDALKGWREDLIKRGVTVAVGSDATAVGKAGGLLWNPGNTNPLVAGVPATPLLYLIDASGVLRNIWMGFVPNEASKMRDDVLKAVSVLK